MTIYDPIINELISLLEAERGEGLLKAAIATAHEAGIPQIETYGITTVDGFLNFANWLPRNESLPIKYAKSVGKHLSEPGSITPASFLTFQNTPTLHINEAIIPEGGFKTFNDFFTRKLKDGMRPIDGKDDPNVIVFPRDPTFDGPINTLLGDSDYYNDFKGGVWMHSFLNTFDYRRQHSPVSGKVLEAKTIQSAAYLEVMLKTGPITGLPTLKPGRRINSPEERMKQVQSPDSLVAAPPASYDPLSPTYGIVDAPDSPGYQFLQICGLITVDSPELGKVAILPIGMAHVSSVVLSVKAGDELKKGDEISYFQFGGSDLVLVFEKDANVSGLPRVDPPTHFNYGQKLATANPTRN
ncbi:hypothetical protein FQN54_004786 [Arachnomyces sp. PD_36]|nr:hypothetical protein FQN54_004786 [Arachnomyces sp. PD_36]